MSRPNNTLRDNIPREKKDNTSDKVSKDCLVEYKRDLWWSISIMGLSQDNGSTKQARDVHETYKEPFHESFPMAKKIS